MKALAVAEAKKSFAKVLRDAQNEEVIVTKHGRPVARINGISKKLSDAYWQKLVNRLEGPSRPIDEMWDEMGVPKPKNLRYKYPPQRPRTRR